jgi:hypothetical protein
MSVCLCVRTELCGYASTNERMYLLIHGAQRDWLSQLHSRSMVTMKLLRTPSSNGSRPIGGINNLLNTSEYCHRAMTGRLAYVCVCVCTYTHKTHARAHLRMCVLTHFHDCNYIHLVTKFRVGKQVLINLNRHWFQWLQLVKNITLPQFGNHMLVRVSVTTNVPFQITPKHTTKNKHVLSNPRSVTNSISR